MGKKRPVDHADPAFAVYVFLCALRPWSDHSGGSSFSLRIFYEKNAAKDHNAIGGTGKGSGVPVEFIKIWTREQKTLFARSIFR